MNPLGREVKRLEDHKNKSDFKIRTFIEKYWQFMLIQFNNFNALLLLWNQFERCGINLGFEENVRPETPPVENP